MRSLFVVMVTVGALLAGDGISKAEFELPRSVPGAKVMQQVGLTEIDVEYECPAVKGRKIWGASVPYDRPWMIGAATTARIRFSRDVTVGDKTVPAGTYSLLAIPGKTAWTFVLNKSPDVLATTRDYKPELDVARVKVPVKAAPHRERITFLFSDLTDDRALLDLEWDNARLSVPILVNTTRLIESEIGSLDSSWRSFSNAARYMLETKKDYDAGLKYIDQSLALQSLEHMRDWYSLWVKAALLAAKGQFGQASELAQTAYDIAHQSGKSFPLEGDLVKAISDWKKKAPPFEKERTASVVGPAAPPSLASTPKENTEAIAPDAALGPGDGAASGPSTRAAPVGDPPPLSRARLRGR